jgi:hypothetical protein
VHQAEWRGLRREHPFGARSSTEAALLGLRAYINERLEALPAGAAAKLVDRHGWIVTRHRDRPRGESPLPR